MRQKDIEKDPRKWMAALMFIAFAVGIFALVFLNVGPPGIVIDGADIDFDGQSPTVVGGRMFVPLDGVPEALGFDAIWNVDKQTITLVGNGLEMTFVINDNNFAVNGKNSKLNTPARIVDDNPMLPLRFLAEVLGHQVCWDSRANAANITTRPIDADVDMSRAMIATREGHAMVITGDGSLWGWGRNRNGEVGDGTTEARHRPVRIMDDVVYVSVGSSHTMAIKSDGSLWGWGRNEEGQLGDGTNEERRSPVHIMDDVVSVAANNIFTMAVTSDGTLWSWGINWNNRIVTEGFVDIYEPFKLMEDVTYVTTGLAHSMVIKTDGSLWGWEVKTHGMFMGDSIPDSIPEMLMEDVVAASSSYWNAMAITADGGLWHGWSINPSDILEGVVPERGGFSHWKDDVRTVSVGGWHIMVIMDDGSLWGAGDNYWGQLGNGDREHQFHFIHLMDDVADVWACELSTFVILNDGSLWGWGSSSALLGDDELGARQQNHLHPMLIMIGS